MIPIALAGPAVEPITRADLKAYLRLDGDDEDDLLDALIAAARVTVERHARLVLVAQTWRLTLPAWPRSGVVALPLWPVIAIDAVRTATGGGPSALLDPASYRLDAAQDPARLLVDPSPVADREHATLAIDFTAGYGAGAAAVPEPLRLAIRRLAAWWFERRGGEGEPSPPRPGLPDDVATVLAPFRRPRLA